MRNSNLAMHFPQVAPGKLPNLTLIRFDMSNIGKKESYSKNHLCPGKSPRHSIAGKYLSPNSKKRPLMLMMKVSVSSLTAVNWCKQLHSSLKFSCQWFVIMPTVFPDKSPGPAMWQQNAFHYIKLNYVFPKFLSEISMFFFHFAPRLDH